MSKPETIYCWCVPENLIFLVRDKSPCTWPDCVNGDQRDPQKAATNEQ